MTEKRDEFLYDEEGSARVYDQVLKGEKIAVTDDSRITEGDLQHDSLNIRGIIAGSYSRQESEGGDWTDISGSTMGVFTKEQIVKLQKSSDHRYLLDPIYAGLLDAFKYFIIGKGIQVSPQDESEEVKEYLDLFMKENKMDGRDRDIIAKSLKAGELYIRKFSKGANGRTAKVPMIRFLNYWEIGEIKYAPGDRETPIAYIRKYIVDDVEETESIPADEIIHIKFAAVDDPHGLPPFMQVMQHCFYYSDWLFNRVVLNRLKTSYYLEEIVDGTSTDVTTVGNATPDAQKTSLSGKVIKRMPKPGSKLTHNKAVTYKWLSPDVKADDAKEDGRAIRMAICAGAQCPEFILGDASQSNYASSLVSQNPFVRKIEWMQDFFEAYFNELFEWVIEYGIENKFLPSMSTETVMKEKASAVGLFRKLKKMFSVKEQFDDVGNIVVTKKIPTKTGVDIQWPNLIAQDVLKDTQAYQLHQNMGIASDETIAQKLGYDYEEEMRKMESQEEKEPEEDPFGGDERDEEINREEPEEKGKGKVKPPVPKK